MKYKQAPTSPYLPTSVLISSTFPPFLCSTVQHQLRSTPPLDPSRSCLTKDVAPESLTLLCCDIFSLAESLHQPNKRNPTSLQAVTIKLPVQQHALRLAHHASSWGLLAPPSPGVLPTFLAVFYLFCWDLILKANCHGSAQTATLVLSPSPPLLTPQVNLNQPGGFGIPSTASDFLVYLLPDFLGFQTSLTFLFNT